MSWDDIINDFQAIVFLKIGLLQSIIVFSMLTNSRVLRNFTQSNGLRKDDPLLP